MQSNDKNPLISVIIHTYNRENYLKEAIDSVLDQTFQNIELIIIDDGSVDATKKLVDSYGEKIRYYYQDNQGIAAAMNRGIELATGDYIAFLDSDDLWINDKLAQQFDAMQQDDRIDMVFGMVQEFISPELTEQEKMKLNCSTQPAIWYVTGAMLAKKNVFQRVGLFNQEQTTGPFLEWYVRSKEHDLKTEVLNSVLWQRRIHLTNHGITHREDARQYLQIVRKNLEYLRNKTK